MFTRRPPPTSPDPQPQHTPQVDNPHHETTINDLSLPELKAFHEHAGAVLAERTAQAREDFRQDFLSKLELFGMSLDDFKQPPRKERKPKEIVIKYRDPANADNVWSGRGKQPSWLQAYLTEGRQLDEFLIEPLT